MHWMARKGRPLKGEITVPGDKSVSHRSIMLGALAEGTTRIRGFLEGEDTRATAAVFQQLGIEIESLPSGERLVHGRGLHGLRGSSDALDCGNAGTGMRLLAGVMAGQRFDSVLIGDASLSKRPMRRVTEPLALMGARIDTEAGGLPPLRIHGAQSLRGIDYATPMASAQVKSAVLLAGLYAEGATQVTEPHPTRDYTERMLAAFGWPIDYGEGRARLSGGHRLEAQQIAVPADFSSAAFFIVAASLIPGSDLLIRNVGIHPRRTGLLRALALMGARIDIEPKPGSERPGAEPVADIRVRHAELHGADIPEDVVPDMIDEFPALFVAASVAEGLTRVRGAAELRVKESDRLGTMAAGLRQLGVQVEETPDGADIIGGLLGSAHIDSHGDHRIAMSFSIAGQLCAGEVRIDHCDTVATSFPGFDALARSIGFELGLSS
ncbi:3-phosphoshikimate 1-carboxyvinyltransferase [Pseudomarimonas arenosa]|uniref:3-phosphoshikimate 1-carboxyvinyltransferase n=1 Tax=Pseudomarimonas arenosa TaxID=2774145 RepID=A0AAW3ZEP0_9GAMM|nr:3-phosphoshikimate 1-carboxyvinyltransferase [Pseudomarimonas arenosa]MBD8524581.1 3-phosphoshikimate 1-carboxyvinyltransferase [Pseudomarimonas arenosa]